jgi:hypothetical protein
MTVEELKSENIKLKNALRQANFEIFLGRKLRRLAAEYSKELSKSKCNNSV